jgi:hypothetical protein
MENQEEEDTMRELLVVLRDLDLDGVLTDVYDMTTLDAPLERAITAWADAGYPGADEDCSTSDDETVHPLDRRIEVDTMAPDATGHALDVVDRAAHRVDPKHWLWDLRELISNIHYDYARR